ncbi:MAG TPA: CAP domain-containing protein [Thermoleophilaceae bacterium]|nr:CAP domain-containing protein [Thermoleophilaceae bacterium]
MLLPASAAQANPAHAVVAKVNSYRAANGLPALRLSRSLSRSSYAYARHLMRSDRFGHSSHIRASSRFNMLGENLAFSWGKRRSARIPVRGWARSAPHRAVLLNRKFRYVGVGRVAGRFGSRRATIWVLHAGR